MKNVLWQRAVLASPTSSCRVSMHGNRQCFVESRHVVGSASRSCPVRFGTTAWLHFKRSQLHAASLRCHLST
eukprot:787028-Amphidinium_carterae.1